ncbi:MAG TPA: hypothetical protein VM452_12450 [Caulifigura sp.]|jgi:hypothetical protein|nr:hypothetical protein [Caulifigura sp.]
MAAPEQRDSDDRAARPLRRLPRRSFLVALALGVPMAGCVNAGALISKMVIGDPEVQSKFHARTKVALGKKNRVIMFATAPVLVMDENSSLTFDVIQQMSRRFELRKINVENPNDVSRVIDRKAGDTDPTMLAREFPQADYLIHIKFNGYGIKEPNSPNLYRGYAAGIAYAWAARGGGEDGGPRQVIQVFEEEFQIEHPKHPVSRDSMSINAFEKQFVDEVSDKLGNIFYDHKTSEIL